MVDKTVQATPESEEPMGMESIIFTGASGGESILEESGKSRGFGVAAFPHSPSIPLTERLGSASAHPTLLQRGPGMSLNHCVLKVCSQFSIIGKWQETLRAGA